MVDLNQQYNRIKTEIDEAIQQVLSEAAFIQGPEVTQFSSDLQKYSGAGHVITCANGTDALQIAMMALGLKSGDEIILPVHTYVATAEVIALLNLVPVFIDVDPDDFTLDVSLLPSKLTSKTKAIVPVHLYGQCANMTAILEFARVHNLLVIEDAAQAIGAVYTFGNGDTKQAGTMGDAGTTSFFPSKNLGCYGDGGAIFTKDQTLAERIKMIANHGQRVKYRHEIIGVNSRLDTMQAAILKVKLKYLDEYSAARNGVADFYDRVLTDIPELKRPTRRTDSTHVWHQYTLRILDGRRDAFKRYLEENGVPSMIYYPIPLHQQPAYKQETSVNSFPITEMLSEQVISLPIHTEMTTDELEYISTVVHNFFS